MSSLEQRNWPKCPQCGLKQPRGGFRCPYCPITKNVSFSYNIQLMVHLKDMHDIKTPPIIPCEICGKTYRDTTDLLQHILIEDHECSSEHLTCNCEVLYLFDTEEHLEKHQIEVHPKPKVNPPLIKAEVPIVKTEINSRTAGLLHIQQTALALNKVTPLVPSIAPIAHQSQPPFPQIGSFAMPGLVGQSALNPFNQTLAAATAAATNPFQQPQPLFHLNVNTNVYPTTLGIQPIQRLTLPLNPNPLASQISSIQQSLNQTMAALRQQAMAAVPKAAEMVDSLQIANTAATILSSRGDICVKIPRKCFYCGVTKSFQELMALQGCIKCPKTFYDTIQIAYHDLERHPQDSMIATRNRIACPVKGCDFGVSSAEPKSYAEILEHCKSEHTEVGCLYHYICPRASCRGLFGTLQGMNAHDHFCKNNISKMSDAKNFITCDSCNDTFYPYSACMCIECNLLISNENELIYHMVTMHQRTDLTLPKFSTSKSIACPFHYICPKKNCVLLKRNAFVNKALYMNHVKLCELGYTSASGSVDTSIPLVTQEKLRQVREAMQSKKASSSNDQSASKSQPSNQFISQELQNKKTTESKTGQQGESSSTVAKTLKRANTDTSESNHTRRRTRFSDDIIKTPQISETSDVVKIKQEAACSDDADEREEISYGSRVSSAKSPDTVIPSTKNCPNLGNTVSANISESSSRGSTGDRLDVGVSVAMYDINSPTTDSDDERIIRSRFSDRPSSLRTSVEIGGGIQLEINQEDRASSPGNVSSSIKREPGAEDSSVSSSLWDDALMNNLLAYTDTLET